MKYKEENIKENIEALFLQTLFYFPQKTGNEIAKIISNALNIEDETIIMYVEVECILIYIKLIDNGTISKCYYDDDKHKAYDSYLSIEAGDFQTLLNNTPKSDTFTQIQKELAAYARNYHKKNRITFPGVK